MTLPDDCRVFAALFLGLAMAVATASAHAQAFDRLADGRVAIDIFGQTIALPTTEADLSRIAFFISPDNKTAFGSPYFSLRDSIIHADKARLSFDLERSFVSVRITTEEARDLVSLILRQFRPKPVPWSGAAPPLAVTIRKAVPEQPPRRGVLPDHWPSESTSPDEDGFFVRFGIQRPEQERPTETGFRLPAAQRLWRTKVDLIVVCQWIAASARTCRQLHQTSDGRISIMWGWSENTWQSTDGVVVYSNVMPKYRWKELDLLLHEAAISILIGNPSTVLE